MSDWKTLSSEEIYKTPWMRVRRDQVQTHTGKELTYSVVELNHPSVTVVATDDKGRILMQRHYRYTLDRTTWGLPAGHSDGQDTLTAAKRELREEAGLGSDEWVRLGQLYSAVGIAHIPFEIFWAKNVKPVTGERDEEEAITEHRFLTMKEFEAMALKDEFEEGGVLSAVYLAKLHGL